MNCCVSYSILIWYSYLLYRIMNDSYCKTLLRIKLFQIKDTHNLSYLLSFLIWLALTSKGYFFIQLP